ncbi:NAD kinase 2, mitochondrial-like isoform X2 [Patella vulgata]|uniref:NAD kinase 2, mitochondrial-like isoform X2 n=1 Tax=Patella vulgata TaxID=6465 RepID=UPI0024A997BC|nr:NAD kinase 2, mitochondrial-like isoform X2 [Patella vulgata]
MNMRKKSANLEGHWKNRTSKTMSSGIKTQVVDRWQFGNKGIEWADVVFSAGGDGTFLLAASKVKNKNKPLIGLNTDPVRSEGYLCLPKIRYSAINFDQALKRLLSAEFRWKWRQRIRITMSGQHDNEEPIELHDQQLKFPEHRFSEHIGENEEMRYPVIISQNNRRERVLPVLALNEVFIGESLSSRVSYYELKCDDKPSYKQKSSGLTVCTGTGSSSWFFHINHLDKGGVKEILRIGSELTGQQFPVEDNETLEKITQTFNNSLRFDSSEPYMAYTIRDPVVNAVYKVDKPRDFAKRIIIRSRMWDSSLVIDGGLSFKFNDGAVATLEIFEEDALRTVSFD